MRIAAEGSFVCVCVGAHRCAVRLGVDGVVYDCLLEQLCFLSTARWASPGASRKPDRRAARRQPQRPHNIRRPEHVTHVPTAKRLNRKTIRTDAEPCNGGVHRPTRRTRHRTRAGMQQLRPRDGPVTFRLLSGMHATSPAADGPVTFRLLSGHPPDRHRLQGRTNELLLRGLVGV